MPTIAASFMHNEETHSIALTEWLAIKVFGLSMHSRNLAHRHMAGRQRIRHPAELTVKQMAVSPANLTVKCAE